MLLKEEGQSENREKLMEIKIGWLNKELPLANKYMEKQAVRQVCKFSKLAQNACFVPCSQKQKNSFNKDNAGEAAVKLCLWCYILVQLSENRSAICI